MAFDCFLKITDIPGESTDDKHKEWIEILSFQVGCSQSASSASTGGARSTGRCNWSDASVSKTCDKASAKLMLALCKGTHIKEALVVICRATGDKQKYMEYKMEDVLITNVSSSTHGGGESLPMELVAMNFGKITWTYTQTDHKTGKPSGDVAAHWDNVQNKGG
jgi:type VI secretion system secreted protein Hcp